MFNENSAMQDRQAGADKSECEPQGPIVSAIQQTNTETPTPSVTSGATNLQWWDDMKYYWKTSRNGGFHLAPQDSYVDDVLVEGDVEIQAAAKSFMAKNSADLTAAKAEAKAAIEIVQTRTGFDTAGTETNAFIRMYRDRAVIARKICGAAAVSANHRLQNAAATTGDIDAVKDTDFYKSDLENCRRWAFKACYYEYVIAQLPENEVIKDLPALIASGVGRSLYDDAVERGNKLKRPAPAKQASAKKLSAEELRLMRA
jgi:hypothetical protein